MRLLAPKKRAVDQCVAATGFSRAKIYRWIKQGKLIWQHVKRPGGDRWLLKLTCVGKPNSDRIPTWRRFNRACDRHGLDPGRVLAAILLGAITQAIDGHYVFVDVDKVTAGVRLVLADSGELFSALQGVQPAAPGESFPAWLGEKFRPPEGITLAPETSGNPAGKSPRSIGSQFQWIKQSFRRGNLACCRGRFLFELPVDYELNPATRQPRYLTGFKHAPPGWAMESIRRQIRQPKTPAAVVSWKVHRWTRYDTSVHMAVERALDRLESNLPPMNTSAWLLRRRKDPSAVEVSLTAKELEQTHLFSARTASQYCWAMWQRIHERRFQRWRASAPADVGICCSYAMVNRVFGASRAARTKWERVEFTLDVEGIRLLG